MLTILCIFKSGQPFVVNRFTCASRYHKELSELLGSPEDLSCDMRFKMSHMGLHARELFKTKFGLAFCVNNQLCQTSALSRLIGTNGFFEITSLQTFVT